MTSIFFNQNYVTSTFLYVIYYFCKNVEVICGLQKCSRPTFHPGNSPASADSWFFPTELKVINLTQSVP